MLGRLAIDLGFLENSQAYNKILEGEYIPPQDTDNYAKDLLYELKKPLISNSPKALITTEDFIQGWNKAKEYTLSGISRIHFGYLKVCS